VGKKEKLKFGRKSVNAAGKRSFLNKEYCEENLGERNAMERTF